MGLRSSLAHSLAQGLVRAPQQPRRSYAAAPQQPRMRPRIRGCSSLAGDSHGSSQGFAAASQGPCRSYAAAPQQPRWISSAAASLDAWLARAPSYAARGACLHLPSARRARFVERARRFARARARGYAALGAVVFLLSRIPLTPAAIVSSSSLDAGLARAPVYKRSGFPSPQRPPRSFRRARSTLCLRARPILRRTRRLSVARPALLCLTPAALASPRSFDVADAFYLIDFVFVSPLSRSLFPPSLSLSLSRFPFAPRPLPPRAPVAPRATCKRHVLHALRPALNPARPARRRRRAGSAGQHCALTPFSSMRPLHQMGRVRCQCCAPRNQL